MTPMATLEKGGIDVLHLSLPNQYDRCAGLGVTLRDKNKSRRSARHRQRLSTQWTPRRAGLSCHLLLVHDCERIMIMALIFSGSPYLYGPLPRAKPGGPEGPARIYLVLYLLVVRAAFIK